MSEDEARTAVRATLAVMARLAECTRTSADDMMVQLLRAHESKLTTVVLDLVKDAVQPPSAERITAALSAVGIRVGRA